MLRRYFIDDRAFIRLPIKEAARRQRHNLRRSCDFTILKRATQ